MRVCVLKTVCVFIIHQRHNIWYPNPEHRCW